MPDSCACVALRLSVRLSVVFMSSLQWYADREQEGQRRSLSVMNTWLVLTV